MRGWIKTFGVLGLAILVLIVGTLRASDFVKSNNIPGDIFLGSQRVMRLAPLDGFTLGERTGTVNDRLRTLQGRYPLFDPDRIVLKQMVHTVVKNGNVSERKAEFVIGYYRFYSEPAFPDEEHADRWDLARMMVFIPIVTITAQDAKLHQTTMSELAWLWLHNIREAFKPLGSFTTGR